VVRKVHGDILSFKYECVQIVNTSLALYPKILGISTELFVVMFGKYHTSTGVTFSARLFKSTGMIFLRFVRRDLICFV